MSADDVFTFSNWAFFASLIVGVAATLAIIMSSHVRDRALKREVSSATEEAAKANERAEQLRNGNLTLEKEILELRRNVRGREITDEQRDLVVSALKGMQLPQMVVNVVNDPEAHFYALSILDVLSELGMKPLLANLEGEPPLQSGVVFCGDGSEAGRKMMNVFIEAKIAGVGVPGPEAFGHDRYGRLAIPSYCPPGTIFVGRRQPLSEIRSHRLEEIKREQDKGNLAHPENQ